jgi:hypothetical protein
MGDGVAEASAGGGVSLAETSTEGGASLSVVSTAGGASLVVPSDFILRFLLIGPLGDTNRDFNVFDGRAHLNPSGYLSFVTAN